MLMFFYLTNNQKVKIRRKSTQTPRNKKTPQIQKVSVPHVSPLM